MKKSNRLPIGILFIALLVIVAGCSGKQAGNEGASGREDKHENHLPKPITLTHGAMAAAGIKTTPALKQAFRQRLSASGELEFNGRRLVRLSALAEGRIERILTVTGDRVRAGQLLAEIYSPDYMSNQAEFLQAAERVDRFSGDQNEAAILRAFMEGSRERLIRLGATPDETAELRRSGVLRPFLPVRAPFAGSVIESASIPGDHVEFGANLFRLADLSILWASLHIKEKDLAAIETGSAVELLTQAYAGEVFQGRLLLLGDVLDPGTRTIIGRVEVPNPAGKLKAGMYIEAFMFGAGERTALVVPEAAIQDHENRQIVFVQSGERIFTWREIQTGERFSGGMVEILAGLAEGEKVVTSGSFLLKSELNKGSLEDEHGHS